MLPLWPPPHRSGRWKMWIEPTLVTTFYKMEINFYISITSNKKDGQELLSKKKKKWGGRSSFYGFWPPPNIMRVAASHLLIKMTSDHSFKGELLMSHDRYCSFKKVQFKDRECKARATPLHYFFCAYEFSDREEE